jgi:hypothetical protein
MWARVLIPHRQYLGRDHHHEIGPCLGVFSIREQLTEDGNPPKAGNSLDIASPSVTETSG